MTDPREIAFIALSQDGFLQDTLKIDTLDTRDQKLAQEIAYGTKRMEKTLHHLACQLASDGNLRVKRKERILIYMALYQHLFMDKVPPYAIVDTTVTLAKKHCHFRSAGFINALLRKIDQVNLALPQGKTASELSLNYSYPEYYVEKLLSSFGLEQTEKILEAGNQPPTLMARLRPNYTSSLPHFQETTLILWNQLDDVANDPRYYIQNATPVHLIEQLANKLSHPPKKILDLCAAPGGKTLLLADLFPNADLYTNDLSKDKCARLQSNLEKYDVKAHIHVGKGEEYPVDQTFDLIVIDAPCSNTGVLNKRPEARWRLDKEHLFSLCETQKKLIDHAKKLLAPEGIIWYLTCSILPEENREEGILILPSGGWDGGFGSVIP